MEVIDAIKKRRSIRKYKRTPIVKETLIRMLEAARWAPSGGNRQPWEFIVVKNPNVRRNVADLTPGGKFLTDAQVMIVVVIDPKKDPRHYIEDGAIVTTHILLAAHALGVGSCWVGAFDSEYEANVKDILHVPSDFRIASLISLGYPAEERTKERKILKDLVHYEKYEMKSTHV
jgi:nitroreductase